MKVRKSRIRLGFF